MQTITASEFKAKCLKLMDQVAATGEPIRITKNGVPVAELVASPQAPTRSLIGLHSGQIQIHGDIIAPTSNPEDWEALR